MINKLLFDLLHLFFDFRPNDLLARLDENRLFLVAEVRGKPLPDGWVFLNQFDTLFVLVVLFERIKFRSEVCRHFVAFESVQLDEGTEDLLGVLFALRVLREIVLEISHLRLELVCQFRVARGYAIFPEQRDFAVDEALDDVLVHFVLSLGALHLPKSLDRLEPERSIRPEVLVVQRQVGGLQSVLSDQQFLNQLFLQLRALFVVRTPQLLVQEDLEEHSLQIRKIFGSLDARTRERGKAGQTRYSY